jgi:hypothetical protein
MKFQHCCIFFLLLIFSCSKDPGSNKDNESPVISITSPTNGQSFSPGQAIPVTGTISDNDYIAEAHIHVSNTNTGSLLMDVHLYPAGKNSNFNQSFTAVAGTNYKIQVIAKDKAVNESRSSVEVSCN